MINTVETHHTYPNGIVRVKTTSVVYADNGVEIARGVNSKTISPGADYSAESATTKALCDSLHTAEAIASYQANETII